MEHKRTITIRSLEHKSEFGSLPCYAVRRGVTRERQRREPAEEEFGGRVNNFVEVTSGAGVVERVFGAFVLKQYAVVASLQHQVPEPSHLADRGDLVARPALNQRRRIPVSHELDRRVLDQGRSSRRRARDDHRPNCHLTLDVTNPARVLRPISGSAQPPAGRRRCSRRCSWRPGRSAGTRLKL